MAGRGPTPFQRKDGRWSLNVYLEGGKRKTLYGTSPADVRRQAKELEASAARGMAVLDGRTTLGTYLGEWLETVKPTLRPSTWRGYEGHVRLYLIPELGRMPLARLEPEHGERMTAPLIGRGLSVQTATSVRWTLSKCVERALRAGRVTAWCSPPTRRRRATRAERSWSSKTTRGRTYGIALLDRTTEAAARRPRPSMGGPRRTPRGDGGPDAPEDRRRGAAEARLPGGWPGSRTAASSMRTSADTRTARPARRATASDDASAMSSGSLQPAGGSGSS